MFLNILLFALLFQKSSSVIYHLNDTEYYLMPALFGLDEYGGCLRQGGGTYCLARFDLFADGSNHLTTLINEYSEFTRRHYNYTYIERGMCVTKNCKKYLNHENLENKKDLSSILEACLNETIWNEHGLQAKLSNIFYCEQKNKGTETDVYDWIVAAIFAAIIMINVAGSIYDVILHKSSMEDNNKKGNLHLLSFSIFRNWDWLVTSEPENSALRSITGLHGIKCIAIFFVIATHTLFMFTAYTNNPHDYEKFYDQPYFKVILGGTSLVQIFFVMSGFLLAYQLKTRSERQSITWNTMPKIMVLRWWRLTPANALNIAFSATWLRHLGSGPFWTPLKGSVVADCRRYWWLHLLYINNYVPDDKFCSIQTWHIAADMQLICFGLAVHIATKNRGRSLALILLLLLGMIGPALQVWWQNLDGLFLMIPEIFRNIKNDDTLVYMHTATHNYFSSMIIGMAVGYLVYRLQNTKFDINKYRIYNYFIWAIIPLIISMFYHTGTYFFADGPRKAVGENMVYAAFHRLVLGLLVAAGIIGLTMKSNVPLRNFFEWRGWVVPSRLSYSVFLLHCTVIDVLVSSRTSLVYVSFLNMAIFQLGVTAMSFVLAVPFHLLVEAPMNRFMKTVLNKYEYNEIVDKKMK